MEYRIHTYLFQFLFSIPISIFYSAVTLWYKKAEHAANSLLAYEYHLN